MSWLKNYSIYIQGLILSSIIVAAILFTLFLVVWAKPSIRRKSIKYLYAFSSGFILITAIVGQFVAARSSLIQHWEEINMTYGVKNTSPDVAQTSLSMLIVTVGIGFGILAAISVSIYSKKHLINHSHGTGHNHGPELDNEYEKTIHKNKFPAILMILSHRIPAGIAIGGLLVNSNHPGNELALANIISFIIHIIPELLIVYYGFLDSKMKKRKSIIYSILVKLVLIPFIFAGIAFGQLSYEFSDQLFWINPLLFMVVGTLMVWAVISELLPELIHQIKNYNVISKMMIVIIIGIAASMLIQIVHVH